MNYIALFIGTSLTLAACCPTIPLMDPCDNSLTLQLQKTDSPNCGEPDGQITFIHPQPGAQVSYKWSHDPNEKKHNVAGLKPGIYTITVTVNDASRVTQVVIN